MIFIPPSRKIYRTPIFVSSTDESFQKLKLKICELNKSANYKLALLNKKNGLFIWIFK